MYERWFKRWLDIGLSLLAAILLAPVFLLTALAIRLDDGESVFFVQERVGRHGKSFKLFKFRSMPAGSGNIPSAEAAGLEPTRIGRFIRRTNIDELPQLFNVLLGQMSLVGPRPALAAQGGLLAERKANGAYALRPGLTGAAQIHSYDGMLESEKAAWDGRYARRVTFLMDCRIILSTFAYLMRPPPRY